MSNSLSLALGAFLLILVGGNVLLFFLVVVPDAVLPRPAEFTQPPSLSSIQDYLHHLSPQYKTKNLKYEPLQRQLYKSFNSSNNHGKIKEWVNIDLWINNNTVSSSIGQVLQSMKASRIVLADNAQKGTQLKLLLLLEEKQKLFFKPKRYDMGNVINGNIYAGFDRHNSEVLAYYLAIIMNYKWVAPSVIRKIDIAKEIVPVATAGLQKTMINKGHGEWCIYGKCYYCRMNETVCGDKRHHLEGAAILYVDKPFKVNKSPWRRSYGSRKMEWETNDLYCKRVRATLSLTRILDLIEVSIFDFLIQNGDRHRYEVYRDKIMLLDNGKGLGNPFKDELDILAPLYQCCIIRLSTWHQMELLSGGVLTYTIKTLASLQGDILTTEDHYTAIERRLLIVYATVQMCIGKSGGSKVFK